MSIIVHLCQKLNQENKDIQEKITIEYNPELNLAQNIWSSKEFEPKALCLGLAKCKRCLVQFISAPPSAQKKEIELLSPEELQKGMRLACQHQSQDHTEILAEAKGADKYFSTQRAPCQGLLQNQDLFLAIDLGTSSICFKAVDKQSKEVITENKRLNPQLSLGSDVISRLTLALTTKGLAQLNKLIIDCIEDFLEQLNCKNRKNIEIAIAGNSIMTGILLNKDLSGLKSYPYDLNFTTGNKVQISQNLSAYIPPLISAFIGGDISADLACLTESKQSFCIADMGTNGEFIYFDGENYYAASVPLGPAIEGMGLSCGTIYNENVISSFKLSPKGIEADIKNAYGISACAYIQLIHILLNLGLLDSQGHFVQEQSTPLNQNLAKQIVEINSEKVFMLDNELYISSSDIEELLKVKAAFSLAIQELLSRNKNKDIQFVLTGALGKHAPLASLQALGFLPENYTNIQVKDNAVLDGALLLLENPNLQTKLQDLCKKISVLDLSVDQDFLSKYIKNMNFQAKTL